MVFVCSWLTAGYMVCNRLLKGVPDLQIMFFYAITGLVLSSIYMLYDSFQKNNLTLIFSYSPWLYSLFLLISFADIVTIYSGIKSSQCGNLGFIGLIQYVTVFYGFLFDVTIFRDELRAMDVLVSVVILATTMAVSVYKINQEKKQLQL